MRASSIDVQCILKTKNIRKKPRFLIWLTLLQNSTPITEYRKLLKVLLVSQTNETNQSRSRCYFNCCLLGRNTSKRFHIILHRLQRRYLHSRDRNTNKYVLLRKRLIKAGFYHFVSFLLQGTLRGEIDTYFGPFRRCNYPQVTAQGNVEIVQECGRYSK